MLSIALAAASCFAFGTSDYLGAVKTRELPGFGVLLVSQIVGLAIILVVALGFAPGAPIASLVPYAVAAGAVGVMGLGAFWAGLAIGPMGVVAPLAAAAGIVPVVAGIASGERPAPVQIAGIVLLIGGVIVVARTPSTGPAQRIRPLAIWLGLATALCFGSVVVLLGQAGGMGTLWTVLIARITAVACLVAAVPVMVRRGGVGVSRRHMPILVVIGFLDLLANFCMAASASTGLVSIAGPIISLHTVVTILLAAWMLSERLHPVQRFAAAVALAGGALAAI